MQRLLMVALVAGACLVPAARAQQFERPEDKEFFQAYQLNVEANDLLAVEKQVAQKSLEAERVMNALSNHWAIGPNDALMQLMRPLAEALDKRQQGTEFTQRLTYLSGLDGEGLAKYNAALAKLGPAFEAFNQALMSKDKNDYRTCVLGLDEAITALEEAKEMEWRSLARFRKAYCHEQLGEFLDAVRGFDKAMDEWKLEAGRPTASQDYTYMVDKRRELIGKGYTPEGDTPEDSAGSGPAKNTSTSFVEGSKWEEWTTSYKTMKKPDQFECPSPFGSENLLLWKQFSYFEGVNKLDHGEQTPVQPFGTPWKIVREGAHGMMDLDGDDVGDEEAKLLDQKPTLFEATEGGKDGPQYALFLATGGQGQQWLGQQANFQNLGYYRIGCYREGELLGQKFVLIDDNASGAYGDARTSRDGTLRGFPEFTELDAMIIGKGDPVPYSEVVSVGGKWYRLRVGDLQGGKLSTRELNLESGTVKLDWDGPVAPASLVIGEARDLQGAYFDIAGGKSVTVPVGRYKVAVGRIETGKKAGIKQAWIFPGRSEAFEVKPGEETVLAMGAPFTFEVETENKGREFKIKGKSFLTYDRLGAIIGKITPDVVLPEITVRNKENGAILAKKEKSRIIDSEQYNKDGQAAWFMADFVFEKNPNVDCEAKLVLTKKHPLLGDKAESDWN